MPNRKTKLSGSVVGLSQGTKEKKKNLKGSEPHSTQLKGRKNLIKGEMNGRTETSLRSTFRPTSERIRKEKKIQKKSSSEKRGGIARRSAGQLT